jgi:hypothetical protein
MLMVSPYGEDGVTRIAEAAPGEAPVLGSSVRTSACALLACRCASARTVLPGVAASVTARASPTTHRPCAVPPGREGSGARRPHDRAAQILVEDIARSVVLLEADVLEHDTEHHLLRAEGEPAGPAGGGHARRSWPPSLDMLVA